ncbi:DEAD/DEAH box helicase [Ligilactobacillus equi]
MEYIKKLKQNYQEKINQELNIPSIKKKLFVSAGVDAVLEEADKLTKLTKNASLEVISTYIESTKINNDIIEKQVDPNYQWSWVSYEEYLKAKSTLDGFFEVIVLKNNLFYKYFPLTQNLQIAQDIYLNGDEETQDKSQRAKRDFFFKYYGEVTRDDRGNYYVAYQDVFEDVKQVDIFDSPLIEIDETTKDEKALSFEFTSEEKFLGLIDDAIQGRINQDIQIVMTGRLEELPNLFDERLRLLVDYLPKGAKITQVSKETVQEEIKYSQEYHQIMKKYWGYESFRDLSMYKDFRKNNETINISQEQIIDTLVAQGENALQDKPFRDIFVTSPTGAGKSLMFQIPAIFLSEKYSEDRPLTVVISPLISLMQDQVAGMQKKSYNRAVTINSGISPIEKEKVIQQIKNGEIDILYLSTETLQNRGNIRDLIGERKIGLFIVDEAHIVTTWGKSFRADYWYMGIYLQKLRKEYNFPLVTFTATAIYAGPEDMYADIRNSLNMSNPISFFGYVKRDDLYMVVQDASKEKFSTKEYLENKQRRVLERLEGFYRRKQKTLVYFPTVRSILRFSSYMKNNSEILKETVGRYYGPLDTEEKDIQYEDFKHGRKMIMLATKAFGMGIDIPDIQNVYHFAPTGDVIDYIQEIGRAARDEDLKGRAFVDYFRNDFSEIKRLHGMSAIKKSQILAVMEKVKEVYEAKKTRHLVMSADDFRYLLQNNDQEDQSIDNRLKIILLMIEKDFENKLGYSPFYARPRQIFGDELIFVNNKIRILATEYGYDKYLSRMDTLKNSKYYSAVYKIHLKDFWESHYKNISYPQFKYYVFSCADELREKDREFFKQLHPYFCTGLQVNLKESEFQTINEIQKFIKGLEEILSPYVRNGKMFTDKEFAYVLQRKFSIHDQTRALSLARAVISTYLQFQERGDIRGIIENNRGKDVMYSVRSEYSYIMEKLEATLVRLLRDKHNQGTSDDGNLTLYRPRVFNGNHHNNTGKEILALGLLEALDLGAYEVVSSDSPQIYIRINSTSPIMQALKDKKKYRNSLLNNVYYKHNLSVEMLKYLFTLPQEGADKNERIRSYTREFWDIIEQYFFGHLPDPVSANLYRKKEAEE